MNQAIKLFELLFLSELRQRGRGKPPVIPVLDLREMMDLMAYYRPYLFFDQLFWLQDEECLVLWEREGLLFDINSVNRGIKVIKAPR